ncbi:unnamed protein product [Ceratitis capitata]|uniref:(Mediterranean fruit fly) hypothetical protein n=1 Tax=Ceratitis capitata TaxID=7213 RepID=A0A811V925_CERCA|nr:unnamed protein product [Ceratitis capitata]
MERSDACKGGKALKEISRVHFHIENAENGEDRTPLSSGNESDDSSDAESPGPALQVAKNIALSETNTQDNHKSKQQGAPAGGASTSTAAASAMASISYAVAEDLTQNSTAGEAKLKHSAQQVSQQDKQLLLTAPNTAECLTAYASSAGLTGLPQDVLLKLIQTGHLQLHTEEDGSGQQYISIPLTTNPAQALNATKDTTNARIGVIETAKDMRLKDAKSEKQLTKASLAKSSSVALTGLPIKQEFDEDNN